MTCPCRNEGSSFVLIEGGKEVPKLCLGFPLLDFFQVFDVLALLMRCCLAWSHDAFVSKHSEEKASAKKTNMV